MFCHCRGCGMGHVGLVTRNAQTQQLKPSSFCSGFPPAFCWFQGRASSCDAQLSQRHAREWQRLLTS